MQNDLTRYRAALADRYEISRELGTSGSSTVYLGRELRHDRAVALKFILPTIAGSVELKRFHREIQIASRLQHPNILPLLDSGEVDGLPFFVTPYVEGASLQDVLNRKKTLPGDTVRRIVREVAEGLTYAHAQGVVHRDVKPANILLSDGHAILTDFGLALLSDNSERLTESISGAGGTVLYMSPEQMQGSSEPDARTDVYSLACVAYEMLSGEPPFSGRTAWSVLARQQSGRFPSLSSIRPDIPAEVDATIGKALDFDPSRRFATPRAFSEALDASLGKTASAAPRISTSRLIAAAVMVVVFVSLAAVAVLQFGGSDPALDSQSVMVFPLFDTRGEGRNSAAGEEAAIMIGAALDHAGPLRWIDGWDWLEAPLRSDMSGWTVQRGVEIARNRGSRYLIDGRIMEEGDSTRVLLRLHDASNGEIVRRSLVAAPMGGEGPSELGRRAVIDLLPSLIDARRLVGTDVLTEFEPAAVAAWLQGERAYRQSDFETALDLFQRAVGLDSTMALAAVRGAQAAGWVLRPSIVDALLTVGLERVEVLPLKYRHLGEGLRSYYAGTGQAAVDQLRRALDLDPTWSDAHMALGEAHYHLLLPDSSGIPEAEAAFQEAVRFDPGFTPALVHLAELAMARGDQRTATGFLDEIQRAAGDEVVAASHLTLMKQCAEGGPNDIDWQGKATSAPAVALESALRAGVGGGRSACAIAAFTALAETGPPSYAWASLLGRYSHSLATDRADDARRIVEAAIEFPRQQHYLAVAGTLSGAPFSDWGESAVRTLQQESVDPPTATQLWAVGALHGSNSRPEGTAWALEAARRIADTSVASPTHALLVEVLEGWDALARGDTTEAIERFAGLTSGDSPLDLAWGLWQSVGAERLMLARLLLERGEYGAALRVAGKLDHPQPVIFLAYRPESLRIRADAASALGQASVAAELRQRLQNLREPATAVTVGSN